MAIAPTVTGGYFGTCDHPWCYGAVFLACSVGALIGPQLDELVTTSTASYLGVSSHVFGVALAGNAIADLRFRPPGGVPAYRTDDSSSSAPGSHEAGTLRQVARAVMENEAHVIPTPVGDLDELEEMYRKHRVIRD